MNPGVRLELRDASAHADEHSESTMRDHIKLLHDVGELQTLIAESADIEGLLSRICAMVAESLDVDVCSVYLLDPSQAMLTLHGTFGLNPASVGAVRLKFGEGLTGLALKELRTIKVDQASKHPNYRYFPESGEETFESFIAAPVTRGLERIGVITAQRDVKHHFGDRDVMALKVVAGQLANMMENIRLLGVTSTTSSAGLTSVAPRPAMVRGRVGSAGLSHGPIYVHSGSATLEILCARLPRELTVDDFRRALAATEEQTLRMEAQVDEAISGGAALIFSSHLLVLKDRNFTGRMEAEIAAGKPVCDAIVDVTRSFTEKFRTSANVYLREKATDIEDLAMRMARNLITESPEQASLKGRVVVAQGLLPSEVMRMSSEGVAGIVLMSGGVTSHLSILARSLRLPLVIVDDAKLLSVERDTQLLLDAETGVVHVGPGEDAVREFERSVEARRRAAAEVVDAEAESSTVDGTRVRVFANVNLLADLDVALRHQAEGIGLYRTEFPFLVRNAFASEEEQYGIYRKVVKSFGKRPVTFRTLDVGGDKTMDAMGGAHEENPFLGLRSIRFSLARRDIFTQQIRAMLRAGAGGNIRIIFPMVSSLEELEVARDLVRSCAEDLAEEDIEHNRGAKLGVMVEVPSAVELIEELAEAADLLAIGTNDLVQYTLGVDRTNVRVSSLYIPHHPAVLRALKRIADAATEAATELSVCGDMAADPWYIPFLLGIGVRELSVSGDAIPKVREAVASVDLGVARGLAARVLSKRRVADVAAALGLACKVEDRPGDGQAATI